MIPEITEKIKFIYVENKYAESYFIPIDTWAKSEIKKVLEACSKVNNENEIEYLVEDMGIKDVSQYEVVEGYGCRLTAPGFLDCTDWCVFDTVEECREYLQEAFEICSYCGEDMPEDDSNNCSNCNGEYYNSKKENNIC